MVLYLRLLGTLFICLMTMVSAKTQDFISVEGTTFRWKGKPYRFMGTNFWYGMNLGAADESGDRDRLIKELDQLAAIGVKNLRIMAASEGPDDAPWRVVPALQTAPGNYKEAVWAGLDFLLMEMEKRGMHAVVCLSNFWPWTGGMAQWQRWYGGKAIPYPPPAEKGDWWKYMNYTARFYKNKAANEAWRAHIALLMNRKNQYTGRLYREDPTIMAWQLANEPRGVMRPGAMNKWIIKTAKFIKNLDANHLVTVGSEGNTSSFTAGNNFLKNHSSKYIDYTTIHIWVQNWGWYDPERATQTFPKAKAKALAYIKAHQTIAAELGKPMVLEEFGISRDRDDHDPNAPTSFRDEYYSFIFKAVVHSIQQGQPLTGVNFWAWGGMGRPRTAHALWQPGDDLIGDPPHEHQGWYSVYDKDQSTISLIQEFANKIQMQPNK